MRARNVLATIVLALALGGGQALWAIGDNSLSVMSWNAYLFPYHVNRDLKFFTGKDLHAGVNTPFLERTHLIALQAINRHPDVILFQEVWGRQNKTNLINYLKAYYPYCFFNAGAEDPSHQYVLDDGLLIASRRPTFMEQGYLFSDRTGDENIPPSKDNLWQRIGAHKGVIFVGVYDKYGKGILIANTHLQSGNEHDAVGVRRKQVVEMANLIFRIRQNDPRVGEGHQIIIGGDFNEAIGWRADERPTRLVNRAYWIGRVFRYNHVFVSNWGECSFLKQQLRPYHTVDVDEYGEKSYTFDHEDRLIYIISAKDEDGAPTQLHYSMVDSSLCPNGPYQGAVPSQFDKVVAEKFYTHDGDWSYFRFATDPTGTALLDHFFIDDDVSELSDYEEFRHESLKDIPTASPEWVNGLRKNEEGKPLRMDAARALSDHSAVMATFTAK